MSEATPGSMGATPTEPATSVTFQPPPAGGVTTTTSANPPPAPTSDDLGDAGKKAITEERAAKKAAEKRAAELQAKVDEFERAKLSEQEKAAKDLADARKAAEEAKSEAARLQLDVMRHRIAAEKGVPAALLSGGDEESLTASAEAALEWRGEVTPPHPTAPRPDPSVGARGDVKLSGAERGRQLWYEKNKKKTVPAPSS
jgi:hypothetical protein